MTVVQLVCPNCQSEDLATVEDLTGSARGGASIDLATGARTFQHDGHTDVWWDSSTSVAVECRSCNWAQKAANDSPALEELKLDESAKVCPNCGRGKLPTNELCARCRRKQRASPNARPEQIGDDKLALAYARWMGGETLLSVAEGLLELVPHLTAQQLVDQLRNEFKRRGWPARAKAA